MYRDRDPAAVYHAEPSYKVENEGDVYTVALRVPGADPGDVEAEQFGDDLVVQIANQRRNVTLPAFLAYYRLAEARVEGGWLRARFVPEP
jgi:arsenite-transporting ATPase